MPGYLDMFPEPVPLAATEGKPYAIAVSDGAVWRVW